MRRRRDARPDGNRAQRTRYTATDFQAAMQGPAPRMVELGYLQARLGPVDALLAQSQPLAGTVYTEHGPLEVGAALVAFGVDKVLYRFGTWVVTEAGLACLVHPYPLSHARLHEPEDWASHLAEQDWVNLWDFLRALLVARHMAERGAERGPQGDSTSPS